MIKTLPALPVPAVPEAELGTDTAMGTANPLQPNHLMAAYPPNPLYPPLFSEDGRSNSVEALLPESGQPLLISHATFLVYVEVAALTEGLECIVRVESFTYFFTKSYR
jgi:hypothetical protein